MKQLDFTYPEFSDVFKLLYTFSDLSYGQNPSPVFKKKKNKDYYTCKYLPDVQLKLEERSFKGYRGVVLEIKDLLNEKVMRSKFMKADFMTFDRKKGFIEFDDYSIKGIDELFPNFYGELATAFHYCSFNNFKKQDCYTLTLTPRNKNKEILIGALCACDLTKNEFKTYKLNTLLRQEHKKLWKEDFEKASKYLKV